MTTARQTDYFAFLGLPRKLNIDAADLEQKFRALSRQFHPDYFHNAPPAERRQSLERSSYLNDAYRTLKNPESRVDYLLTLEGRAPKNAQEAAKQVPPALLEEVFALNEELDDIRDRRAAGAPREELQARLERARTPIEAKRDQHTRDLKELFARWDAEGSPEVLDALRDRVLERNYINNLLAAIERELTS